MTAHHKFFRYYKIYKKTHFRIVRLYLSLKLPKLLRKNNCFLSFKTEFSDTPCFPHSLMGVFISQHAYIGKNCTIFHHVTIGSTTVGNIGAPTIGDNVYIGAGAKVIGNVKVGNNVRIGANCTVVKDIPDNTTVVCAPNRIITRDKFKNNT